MFEQHLEGRAYSRGKRDGESIIMHEVNRRFRNVPWHKRLIIAVFYPEDIIGKSIEWMVINKK